VQVVDYGIDWLTLTHPPVDEHGPELFADLRQIIRSDWYGGQSGVDMSPWGWNGYVGGSMGPLSWGFRPDGAIVRCSGFAARYLLRANWGMQWKCTRIDVQATVRLEGSIPDQINRELGATLGERAGREGRPWQVRHVAGYGQGDSLLIGSRRSPRYFRIYDKEAESGHATEYLKCLRYELEAKNGIAERLFWELYDNRRRPELTLDYLSSALKDVGINSLESANAIDTGFWRVVPRETDAERQLLWMERAVAPVVRKLAAQGLTPDVLQALGLSMEAVE